MISLLYEALTKPLRVVELTHDAQGRVLDFTIRHQEQDNWCWAAVATSTRGFYESTDGGAQCQLANEELGRTTCCPSGADAACDVPWYLDRALRRVGHLREFSNGKASWDTVTSDIWVGGG